MILKLARQDLQQQARWRHEAPQHVRVTAIIDNIRNQTTEGWNRVCKYATETKACMHGWKALLCPYSWPWPCTGKPTHSHGKHTRRCIFFSKKKTQPYCQCQGPSTCFFISSPAGPPVWCLYCALYHTTLSVNSNKFPCIQEAVTVSQKCKAGRELALREKHGAWMRLAPKYSLPAGRPSMHPCVL